MSFPLQHSGRRRKAFRARAVAASVATLEPLDPRRLLSAAPYLDNVYFGDFTALVPGREATVYADVAPDAAEFEKTGRSVRVEFAVSRNSIAGDADDRFIGAVTAVPSGGPANVIGSVRLPSSLATGSYYLVASRDDASGSASAVSTSTFEVIAPNARPDLRAAAPDLSFLIPERGGRFVGGSVNLVATVRNAGDDNGLPLFSNDYPFASVPVSFVLTADDVVGNDDDIALGDGSATLGAYTSGYAWGAGTNLPSSVVPGSYRVAVVIDPGSTVDDSDRSNNVGLSDRFEIAETTADLKALSVSGPASAAAGSFVTLDAAVDTSIFENFGVSGLVYLSTTPTLKDGKSILLGSLPFPLPTVSTESDRVGASSYSDNLTVDPLFPMPFPERPYDPREVQIPSWVSAGSYHLVLVVNGGPEAEGGYREFAETDFSNNLVSTPITVTAAEAGEGGGETGVWPENDYIPIDWLIRTNTLGDGEPTPIAQPSVADIDPLPETARPGQSVSGTLDVGDAEISPGRYRVLLSSDGVADKSDRRVATLRVEEGDDAHDLKFRVPRSLSDGEYHVVLVPVGRKAAPGSAQSFQAPVVAEDTIDVERPRRDAAVTVVNAERQPGGLAVTLKVDNVGNVALKGRQSLRLAAGESEELLRALSRVRVQLDVQPGESQEITVVVAYAPATVPTIAARLDVRGDADRLNNRDLFSPTPIEI